MQGWNTSVAILIVGDFGRYYYITDIVSVRKGLWEVSLSCDVIMTYRLGIKNAQAFVERNENTNNPYIIDKKRVVEEGIDVEEHTVTNELFDETTGSFVLVGFGLSIGGALWAVIQNG